MAYEDDDIGAHELRKQEFRTRYKGMQDIPQLCKIMLSVQATKERLEEELKAVNAEYDVLREEVIPGACDAQGIEGQRIEGVGTLVLTADVRVRCPRENRPLLFKWLRKNRLGDIITETVNSSTLKGFVRDRIKAGKPYPGEIVEVTPFTRASIRKRRSGRP